MPLIWRRRGRPGRNDRRRLCGFEGVSTIVLDRLGPGGQAGGSSKIENFIGFPNEFPAAELATRSVLQMLKFGAKMAAASDCRAN